MRKSNKEVDEPRIYLDMEEPSESIPESEEKPSNQMLKEILDWAKHIVIAVAVGLFLVFFVVQRNEVVGSSMVPNLHESDQLLVQKVSRHFANGIGYEDIITIDADGLYYHVGEKNIIKRVIGLPGDTVDIQDGSVYRNGVKLQENYLTNVMTDERNAAYSHITLGDDEFYVLGDNRSVSLDSRTFGPIKKERIIGEVLFRFLPLDSIGKP